MTTQTDERAAQLARANAEFDRKYRRCVEHNLARYYCGCAARDLSPAEQATLDRFEAAEPAPESLRERVAEALWNYDLGPNDATWASEDAADQDYYREMADAAIAAMRGES